MYHRRINEHLVQNLVRFLGQTVMFWILYSKHFGNSLSLLFLIIHHTTYIFYTTIILSISSSLFQYLSDIIAIIAVWFQIELFEVVLSTLTCLSWSENSLRNRYYVKEQSKQEFSVHYGSIRGIFYDCLIHMIIITLIFILL